MKYEDFLDRKTHLGNQSGFEPLWMPDFLFPFQRAMTEWAIMKGRCAIFADCGLGKTPMQLVWAQNVVERTCKPVLILTPLSVGSQTIREANKFGIEAKQSRDGSVAAPITVTNYQQLQKFDWKEFGGVVCDESSILKNVDGAIKGQVTDFMRKLPYRLLCTATAAPNDYIELGTSSEAIGDLGFMDMLNRFFKKSEQTMSRREEFRSGLYRFRGHSEKDYWRWICSWARAVRKPSDIGFSDDEYRLPELKTIEHLIMARTVNPHFLFDLPRGTAQRAPSHHQRAMRTSCRSGCQYRKACRRLVSSERGRSHAGKDDTRGS